MSNQEEIDFLRQELQCANEAALSLSKEVQALKLENQNLKKLIKK